MIHGKLQQVITMKIYGPNGDLLGEKAKYVYKPILLWRDVIVGLSVAFVIATQLI